MKSLLYFGSGAPGSTSLQRFNSLCKIYPNCTLLDSRKIFPDRDKGRPASSSIQVRLGFGPLYTKAAKYLITSTQKLQPDILWIDAGYLVTKSTIEFIKSALNSYIVHYTPDSISAPGMNSYTHKESLKLYDLVVTTKQQDIDVYKSCMVSKLYLSFQGYDPTIHAPIAMTNEDIIQYKSDIAFVGNYEREKADLLISLSHDLNATIHIYGDRWTEFYKKFSSNTKVFGKAQGSDYAKAICGSKINLGLLNHKVGDQYTTRSFEIPAIGGFLLAENTKAHRDIFEKLNGAALFDSYQDLYQKIKYFLTHESERNIIATNGQKIIKGMNVTWDCLMNEICKQIQ